MLDYGLSLGDKNRDLYLSQSLALHAPELVIKRRNSVEFFRRALCFRLCFNRECVTALVSITANKIVLIVFIFVIISIIRIIYIHGVLILLFFLRGQS
jgi:hypothetical protein